MSQSLTAFTDSAQSLRAQLREAALDHAAFETPLLPCELIRCRATCCHDGAVLSDEEAGTIRSLLENHPIAFADTVLSSPDDAISTRDGSPKTATRPATDSELADDFPAHFPRTRCLFLDREHKCTLQLLSAELSHHPWFFKPISCWMHPVLLRPAPTPDDRPVLTLRPPENDSARFASCTHCGRPDPDGQPASQVLAPELTALSQLAGRDFLAELNAPSSIREIE